MINKMLDKEFADRAVMYTCLFGLGFVVGMLIFGG
jgi:hypothetical protein